MLLVNKVLLVELHKLFHFLYLAFLLHLNYDYLL